MFGRVKKIHFVGIGGIGMSGIAELLLNKGFEISGSDMAASRNTEHLERLGIHVTIGHNADLVVNVDVVVKSSAVKDSNPEVAAALAAKVPVIRRAEMLAEIMRLGYGIGIAGTHGKTTTTSMTGMVLKAAGLNPTVIVGGVVKNFGTNNMLGSDEYIVVEADEFDRSFLSLSPIIAGITNIEADHLDCYRNLDGVKEAFIEYANKVPFFGSVIACLDDPGVQSVIPHIKKEILTYGFSKQAIVQGRNLQMRDFRSTFEVLHNGEVLGEVQMSSIGRHNVQNALLAIATGLELDIPFCAIQQGLAEYSGVYRRCEQKGRCNDIILYDDYAHHPTEIEATLNGLRDNTDRRIIAVFQPHLYSRTRDFHEEFGRAFFQSDLLIVTPIYPAREEPIPGISGKLIADAAVQSGHKSVQFVESNDDIVATIAATAQPGDLVITIGAGSIVRFGEEFLATLEKNGKND
jgi:UDP-N-acetylmuramate--alanine ligase